MDRELAFCPHRFWSSSQLFDVFLDLGQCFVFLHFFSVFFLTWGFVTCCFCELRQGQGFFLFSFFRPELNSHMRFCFMSISTLYRASQFSHRVLLYVDLHLLLRVLLYVVLHSTNGSVICCFSPKHRVLFFDDLNSLYRILLYMWFLTKTLSSQQFTLAIHCSNLQQQFTVAVHCRNSLQLQLQKFILTVHFTKFF